jgi:hypothetical protein
MWSLSGTTVFNMDNEAYDIANFDCKMLVLKINDSYIDGDETRLTFTRL